MVNKMFEEHGSVFSDIRELFQYGIERKKVIGEDKVFDFSIGNPSAPAPKSVNKTIIELVSGNSDLLVHGYSTSLGFENVRINIAKSLNEKYHAGVDHKYLCMTCGAAAALAISFHALYEEGDEGIIIAPFFAEYKVFAEAAGYKLRYVSSHKEDLLPKLDELENTINEHTKFLIINSPNNPTGVFYKEKTIKDITRILKKKEEEFKHPIFLISDEPYREIVYDDLEYPFVTNYYDDSIVCYSFSKALSLPGERIGYVLVNPKCKYKVEVFNAVKGAARCLGYVCAPSLFQNVVGRVVGDVSDISIYKENRDLLYKNLIRIGYEVVYPQGAFYMFVKALEDDDKAFSNRAKEFELLLVPSNSFGIKGYVRLAYCVDKAMIERSIPAFEKLYASYEVKK